MSEFRIPDYGVGGYFGMYSIKGNARINSLVNLATKRAPDMDDKELAVFLYDGTQAIALKHREANDSEVRFHIEAAVNRATGRDLNLMEAWCDL